MTIGALIVTLVLVGFILWLVNTFIPMDARIKNVLNILVIILLIVWLMNAFGLLGGAFLGTPLHR